eukprot:6478159-Amphidinium_carterae.2
MPRRCMLSQTFDKGSMTFGFMEAESLKTKTNLLSSGKRLVVPLVGMAGGVSELPCAVEWLRTRT